MTVWSLYGKVPKVWLTIAANKVITFAPLYPTQSTDRLVWSFEWSIWIFQIQHWQERRCHRYSRRSYSKIMRWFWRIFFSVFPGELKRFRKSEMENWSVQINCCQVLDGDWVPDFDIDSVDHFWREVFKVVEDQIGSKPLELMKLVKICCRLSHGQGLKTRHGGC